MIYHLKAIATGKIEDLPYSTKDQCVQHLTKHFSPVRCGFQNRFF